MPPVLRGSLLGDALDFLAVLSGFHRRCHVGMTGIGGGSLMTPLLIGVFKLSPREVLTFAAGLLLGVPVAAGVQVLA